MSNPRPEVSTAAPLLHLDITAVRNFAAASRQEWLETNGRGGYAASTVVGCPMRRQHGWLVAPAVQGKRYVFLARMDEAIARNGAEFAFSCAHWPGVVAPRGDLLQTEFELAPHPVFTYAIDGLTVRREILMPKGRHAALVRYSVVGGGSAGVELRLRPLLGCREADALTFANTELTVTADKLTDGIRCQPYAALPAVAITWSAGSVEVERPATWYRDATYPIDVSRGYEGKEDNWSPCRLRLPLREGAEVVLAVSVEAPIVDPRGLFAQELQRRRKVLPASLGVRERVALAADDFLFRTDAGRLTVNAGYPWFGEWGRDTFVSLPGLTLARGQLDTCAEVLAGAIPFLRQGLLPNTYGLTPESSDYNSVDASLWFARAALLWAEAGGKRERLLDEFLPALTQIADHYAAGTAGLGIGLTADGLLRAGGPDLNPTWMDARTAAGPVTPRQGCAVELNALFYWLLVAAADLCQRKKDRVRAERYTAQAKALKAAFLSTLWLEDADYLADRASEGGVDRSVRPNMVIAAALPESPLTKTQRRAVVERARLDLLTDKGLRTLAPTDAAYRGRYEGGPDQRDGAYHQGTVWPWLLGFYVEAALRAQSVNKKLVAELRGVLAPLAAELDDTGLNHVSEVFDGDAPQRPGGTFAQAWNTAEWLRALRLLDEADKTRA